MASVPPRKAILKLSTVTEPKEALPPIFYPKGAIYLISSLMLSWIAVNQLYAQEQQYIYAKELYSPDEIAIVDLILGFCSIFIGIVLTIITDRYLDLYQIPAILFPLILLSEALVTISTSQYNKSGPSILRASGLMLLSVYAVILTSYFTAIAQFFPQERETLRREKAFLITCCFYHFGFFLLTCFSPIAFVVCVVENSLCYQIRFVCYICFTLIAWITFVAGNGYYIELSPMPRILGKSMNCIIWGLKSKFCYRTPSSPTAPRHWLFLAGGKYSSDLISDIRQVIRLFHFFWTIPLFWTGFKLRDTKWVRISQRTNQKIDDTNFPTDYLFLLNSLVIILGTFIFFFVIYPLIGSRKFIQNPLRRMLYAGIIIIISDVMSNHIKYEVTKNFPSLPQDGQTNVVVLNALPCKMDIQLDEQSTEILDPYSSYKYIGLPYQSVIRDYVETNWQDRGPDCKTHGLVQFEPEEGKNYALVLGTKDDDDVIYLQSEELSQIPPESLSTIRLISYAKIKMDENTVLLLHNKLLSYQFDVGVDLYPQDQLYFTSYRNIQPLKYTICWILSNYSKEGCNKTRTIGRLVAQRGAIYNLLVAQHPKHLNSYNLSVHESTRPSNFNIEYQIPQFILIGIAELLFQTASFEFFYSQSPPSFRSFILIMYCSFSIAGNGWIGILSLIEILTLPYLKYFAYNLYPIIMSINVFIFFELMRNYSYI